MLHASALLLMTHCSQFLGFEFCWINSWLGLACGFLLFSFFRALSAFSLYSYIPGCSEDLLTGYVTGSSLHVTALTLHFIHNV